MIEFENIIHEMTESVTAFSRNVSYIDEKNKPL